MALSQHYRLREINSEALTGPLSGVMEAEAAQRPFLFSTLKALSRMSRDKRLELLGLKYSVDENCRFHAKPTGLLGPTMGRKVISGLEKVVNGKGWPILRRASFAPSAAYSWIPCGPQVRWPSARSRL